MHHQRTLKHRRTGSVYHFSWVRQVPDVRAMVWLYHQKRSIEFHIDLFENPVQRYIKCPRQKRLLLRKHKARLAAINLLIESYGYELV